MTNTIQPEQEMYNIGPSIEGTVKATLRNIAKVSIYRHNECNKYIPKIIARPIAKGIELIIERLGGETK